MSLLRVLPWLFLILATASSGISQQEKLKVNQNGQLEVSPEMAEKAKRQRERLHDPSFIKLQIEPESNCQDEESKKISDCYESHSKIKVKLLMTNTSSEAITITIDKSSYSYHLQLLRDGQLVPYRKDVAETVAKPRPFVSLMRERLEPGKTKMADMIYLDEWYRPLEPGHYQLEIKHRFQLDGGWTDTALATFEVEPK